MSKPLTPAELKELKRGDSVCIQGRMYIIMSKGPKWMYTTYPHQPISVQTGRLKNTGYGTGDEHPVFLNQETYRQHQEQLKFRSNVVAVVRSKIGWNIPMDLTQDLHAVLVKHGVMA